MERASIGSTISRSVLARANRLARPRRNSPPHGIEDKSEETVIADKSVTGWQTRHCNRPEPLRPSPFAKVPEGSFAPGFASRQCGGWSLKHAPIVSAMAPLTLGANNLACIPNISGMPPAFASTRDNAVRTEKPLWVELSGFFSVPRPLRKKSQQKSLARLPQRANPRSYRGTGWAHASRKKMLLSKMLHVFYLQAGNHLCGIRVERRDIVLREQVPDEPQA
jgi:hypothetical protein